MIANFDELLTEAEQIAKSLAEELISDDGNAAASRGSTLGSYVARTGKMLADAKYHQDMAYHTAVSNILIESPRLQPSIIKELAQSKCANENHLVTLIERLNRASTHQFNFCITIISKAKAEMQLQPRMV